MERENIWPLYHSTRKRSKKLYVNWDWSTLRSIVLIVKIKKYFSFIMFLRKVLNLCASHLWKWYFCPLSQFSLLNAQQLSEFKFSTENTGNLSHIAGLSSPRAESARAFTGRRNFYSGRGEDFLSRQPIFFTETAVTPERKVEKWFPKWEINRHVKG